MKTRHFFIDSNHLFV